MSSYTLRLLAGLPASVVLPKEEIVEKSAVERERIAKDARRTNFLIQKHARERERDLQKPRRTVAESLAAVEIIKADMDIAEDAKADQRIEEAASRLRKADPSLTKAGSVVKAMNAAPDLYTAHCRHIARQQGYLNDDPREIQKAQDADAILEEAGAALRRADPKLTKAQSIAAAVRLDPSLYNGGR